MPPAETPTPAGKTLLGHPIGLFILFFTEMWERMSYYGMRSLLVLYMTEYLFLKPDVDREVVGYSALTGLLEAVFGEMSVQQLSSQIYGLYTAFVYFTPFFGGMLADQIFGQKKMVVTGALLMAFGHFLMASEQLFFPALFFLILGNGCFKPNISTQVGNLYPEGDPRRDGAFTIFYMGINLGAFFSPLVCGTLGQKFGWHWGFGAAGVGMVIGLVLYLAGQRYLAKDSVTRRADAALQERTPLTSAEKKGIWALVTLCALNVVFWAVYEQQGNTMQLWADNNTDWVFLGWEVPSTWFQSLNPLLIFLLAPLLSMFWKNQATAGREPSSITKMAIGCFLLGGSFIIMIIGASIIGDGRGSVLWLLGTVWVLTVGELYLSPIGLSLVTKVAPARLVSMMMGMWFLSSFFGNYLSGYIGTYWEVMSKQSFFALLTVLGVGAGFAMWAVNRPLNRAIGHKV